jgi:hypothetical protein
MEINETFLTDKLASLQQQLAHNSQMFLQAQANVNAVQGAIQSTTEMLNYIRQKDDVGPNVPVEKLPETPTEV